MVDCESIEWRSRCKGFIDFIDDSTDREREKIIRRV